MVFQMDTETKEAVKDRRMRGIVLAIIGLAVLGRAFWYLAGYRADVFVVTWATPETDWPRGFTAVALLGIILIAAGVRVYRPSAAESLIGSGIAMTLIGVFEYWWDEMLIAGDGYPNANWAFTIPVTAVGLVFLVAGTLLRRRGPEPAPDA